MDRKGEAHRRYHWYVELFSNRRGSKNNKRRICVSDDSLLRKKLWKEVLEPFSVRTDRTRTFLELFKPGIEYFCTPLNDVCGPTGYDPNVQALVVSKETLSGAESSTFSWLHSALSRTNALFSREEAGRDVIPALARICHRRHLRNRGQRRLGGRSGTPDG